MKEAVIAYDNVDICYDGRPVVRQATFSLQPGEILGIVGESGSGKSTLLQSAMNLLGPGGAVTQGHIWFQGQDILALSDEGMRRLCGAQMAMVFQDAAASLCPVRTIGSQICEAAAAHLDMGKEEVRRQTLELFARLGFSDGRRVWESYPFELSGGMNQRAALVLVMLLKPALLLADEPTSALDVCAQKQVLDELLYLRDQYGTAIMLVTHDMGVVSRVADYVLVVKEGQMIEYGPAKDVLASLAQAYTKELLAAVPKLRRDRR